MTDIHIEVDAINKHANNLLRAADEVHSIRASADGINLGDGAFGVMCAMLPPVINLFRPVATLTMSGTAGLLDASAHGLKAAADDMSHVDHGIAQVSDFLKSRLGDI